MKSLLLAAALSCAAIIPGRATSVTLSGSPTGRDAVDSSLTALENGDLVLIGTFLNPLALGAAPVADLQSGAGWTPFGNALSIAAVFGHPGKLVGTSTDATTTADFFNDRQIYLWVFNAPTIEQSTEWGIFTAAGASPPWIFPTNGGGIGDLLTISVDAPKLVAVDGLGGVSESHLQLISVPEPASCALLALAAAFFARRARSAISSKPHS